MHPHAGRRVAAAVAAFVLAGVAACSSPPPDDGSPVTDPVGDRGGQPAPPGEAGVVTLAFAGDVHFEAGLAALPSVRGSTLGPMSHALRTADVAVANLETAVTDRGEPAAKELEDPAERYWFRAPASALDVLDRSGVDVVSVANNHAGDYGVRGLRDTLRAGERAGIAVVGAGRDSREAFTAHRVSVRGTDVAVLAADASRAESVDPVWTAVPGSGPGLAAARVPHAPQLLAAVSRAAGTDDVVVVYLHWGEEGDPCPSPFQRRLAGAVADAGADVVVGSHAHVLLGAGMLDDTYVGYGLGNFHWYHGARSETGVLRLTVEDGRVVHDELRPARIPPGGGGPVPLGGSARVTALDTWRSLRGCTGLAPGPAEGAPSGGGLPSFTAPARAIGPALARRMAPSHDPATCPVPLTDLRLLSPSYVGFDGRARRGQVVVHRDVVADVRAVLAELYEARFPIRRMRLVDAYGGDDDRSMADNNSSGYNCRRVAGQADWSAHAYGRALDLNPVQNPYLLGGGVLPPSGTTFTGTDRSPSGGPVPPGVVRRGDVVHRAFTSRGWTWGGDWAEPDYQHFSAPAPRR